MRIKLSLNAFVSSGSVGGWSPDVQEAPPQAQRDREVRGGATGLGLGTRGLGVLCEPRGVGLKLCTLSQGQLCDLEPSQDDEGPAAVLCHPGPGEGTARQHIGQHSYLHSHIHTFIHSFIRKCSKDTGVTTSTLGRSEVCGDSREPGPRLCV